MFLALKEMRYSKLRYSLIVGIMFLIGLVVFLLSGLADGLSQEFRQTVDDWNAKEIVLSDDANNILAASQLKLEDVKDIASNEKAPLSLYSGAIGKKDNKVNISLFGTNDDAFFLPSVTSGKSFKKDNEVIISQNLADKGFKINDTITVGSNDLKVKVVGIVPSTSYIATPVMYSNIKTATEIKFGEDMVKTTDNYPINAVLSNDSNTTLSNDSLTKLSTQKFIDNLPGYTEQSLTLDSMIYVLFVIASAVIGIFMYVITLQKTAIFGVMKVQGINSWFISKSILAQSFLVGVFGVILSGVATYFLSLVLPEAMPFAINITQWCIYGIILVIVSTIGGLFSIVTVNKVDPINAIGG